MLVGTFVATKEAISSAIGLQRDIIAAQATIRGADKEVVEAKDRLSTTTSQVTTLLQQANAAKSIFEETKSKLQEKIDDLQMFQKPENLGNVYLAVKEACPEKFDLKGEVALVTNDRRLKDEASAYRYMQNMTGSEYHLRRAYLCIRK
jgi:hypothetical protein